jgi:hypothetical protein
MATHSKRKGRYLHGFHFLIAAGKPKKVVVDSPARCVQNLAMTKEPEALMAVVERLTARFPDQQRSVIEEIVAEEHGLLDDGPIRDFIPVLVERAAKIRLSRP